MNTHTSTHNEIVIRMKNITKKFPGVEALKNVDFELKSGEVHVLFGENGAGKSTLIKVLSGVYQPTSGEIYVKDKKVNIKEPQHANKMGISVCHQERSLVPQLSVIDNLFLGRQPKKGIFIDFAAMKKKAKEKTRMIGINIEDIMDKKVMHLSLAKQQMVEITKALVQDVKILILDEPSASLTNKELTALYDLIKRLKKNRVGIIYISHRINEIKIVADRVTILRDGMKISTIEKKEDVTEKKLIEMITGRSKGLEYPVLKNDVGKDIIRLKDVSTLSGLRNISFSLKEGEIIGIGGLEGSGKEKIGRLLFGIESITEGEIEIFGEEIRNLNPKLMLSIGAVYFPADKTQSLFMLRDQKENQTILSLKKYTKMLFLNKIKEEKEVKAKMEALKIRPSDMKKRVIYLSGGNQKKILISRSLIKNAKILIIDEITHGIDVSAKIQIYELIKDLAQKGLSIILISSEMGELLNMTHRILTVYDNRIFKIMKSKNTTRDNLLNSYFGINV
jgi:ribose transport system ATP-binding protein